MVSNETQDCGPDWLLRPRRAIAGHRPLNLAYLCKTQLRKNAKPVVGMLLRQGFPSGLKSRPSGPCLWALQLCRYGEGFGIYMGNLPIFVISMGCIPFAVPRNSTPEIMISSIQG